MTQFAGKNVVITGAASGLGKMFAEQAAKKGAHVLLWDYNPEALKQVSHEFAQKNYSHRTYVVDVTDKQVVYDTAQRAKQDVGHVDILVNNAGIVSGKSLLEASDDDIERTFDVNTLSLFWTTRAFLPEMLERNQGHIVTVASAAGITGVSKLVDYSSSKFAAFGFDDSLRLELRRQGSKVQTTSVCPYYIDTGMFDGVKTKFPLILPILKPEYVVGRMIKAVEKNQKRIVMPKTVYAVFAARLLPVNTYDAVMDFLGVNKTMDEFKGREKGAQILSFGNKKGGKKAG